MQINTEALSSVLLDVRELRTQVISVLPGLLQKLDLIDSKLENVKEDIPDRTPATSVSTQTEEERLDDSGAATSAATNPQWITAVKLEPSMYFDEADNAVAVSWENDDELSEGLAYEQNLEYQSNDQHTYDDQVAENYSEYQASSSATFRPQTMSNDLDYQPEPIRRPRVRGLDSQKLPRKCETCGVWCDNYSRFITHVMNEHNPRDNPQRKEEIEARINSTIDSTINSIGEEQQGYEVQQQIAEQQLQEVVNCEASGVEEQGTEEPPRYVRTQGGIRRMKYARGRGGRGWLDDRKRKYTCAKCGFKFTRMFNLTRHEIIVHNNIMKPNQT